MNAVLDEAFKDDGGSIMGGFVEKWIEQGKQEGLQEGLQKGLQKGLQEGRQQELRNSILDLLRLRFDAAPPEVTQRLGHIDNLEILRQLLRQAATAESITAFEHFLESQ